ncbi:MAG: TerB family tellurite resistance protein, partial [Gammaproteobacteria bacterium]|nr:TerB family tellurite resistance protein [Gammaproteobacteria bacterium]
KDIVNETVLLVLARATAADTNIKHLEVESVREIIKKNTGEDVSAKDVRMASHSGIFDSDPLERHLARVCNKIEVHDRVMIAKALAEVILVDERVTGREVRFFNMVAEALDLTPANIAGLMVTH